MEGRIPSCRRGGGCVQLRDVRAVRTSAVRPVISDARGIADDGRATAYQRISTLATGGRPWDVMAHGAEAEVDAVLARARTRDRDLWVIEIEDRAGRTLLDEVGLAD